MIRLDAKSLELETAPGQKLICRITTRTNFETVPADLSPGDYLRVDVEDAGGVELVAIVVELDEKPDAEERESSSLSEAPEWKDPGVPVLIRRAPGDNSPAPRREPSEPPPPASLDPAGAPSAPEEVPEENPAAAPAEDVDTGQASFHHDPLIDKAIRANMAFTANLLDFTCRQIVTRLESNNLGRKWKKLDVVEADVVYVQEQEYYRNITVNGKPSGDGMRDTGGQWSTGEYGTILRNILHPGIDADFQLDGPEPIRSRPARVYRYRVLQEQSQWSVGLGSKREIRPAYKGRLWIDEETGRVLRVEMVAQNVPHDFPLVSLETMLEWGPVTIDKEEHLMPVEAANLACYRHSAVCRKNEIVFRDYQKFSATSSVFNTDSEIDFGGEAKEPENP